MPLRSPQAALPLPRGWRKVTRAGVLHAIPRSGLQCPLTQGHGTWRLARTPLERLSSRVKSIFDFKFEDFELLNYDPLPHIKAPVAV